jgi:hypothetical protein
MKAKANPIGQATLADYWKVGREHIEPLPEVTLSRFDAKQRRTIETFNAERAAARLASAPVTAATDRVTLNDLAYFCARTGAVVVDALEPGGWPVVRLAEKRNEEKR